MKTKTNINSIHGLGNDIIEIKRIKKALDCHGQSIIDKLFTEKEQKYCLKFKKAHVHFAGRFAAKEAIAKALGTGIGSKLNWREIEILPDSTGKPIVHLSKKAKEEFNDPKILLSISHCENYALATAILC